MDIFSMDFTLNEITFLRQSLDLVTIKGTDDKFLAGLQIKLEHELAEIQRMIEEEATVKVESFKQIQLAETNKNTGKK